MKSAPIAILTDFGSSDPFVGIMKGVCTHISPQSPLIDLHHHIPPGDIHKASIHLWQAFSYFPEETVFLTVIDPGVGTPRRGLICKAQNYWFVGPDNGVFNFVLDADFQAWEIDETQDLVTSFSATFHGRDIFAPVAANLAKGVSPNVFGLRISNPTRLENPILRMDAVGQLHGEVLFADQFGNILTSLGRFQILNDQISFNSWVGDLNQFSFLPQTAILVLPNGKQIDWAKTFQEIPKGSCCVLIGSSGLLEVASYQQSAADMLNLKQGDPLLFRFEPQG